MDEHTTPSTPPQPPQPPRFSPPTNAETTPTTRPPSWPTTIGVLSLVFAGLSTLGGIVGILGAIFFDTLANFSAGTGPQGVDAYTQLTLDVQQDFMLWSALSMLLFLAVTALLAAAGITALQRKPITRTLHLAYAAGRLLSTAATTLVTIVIQLEIENRATALNIQPTFTSSSAIAIAGAVLGAAWYLTYPAFCLIWFSRTKVKQDIRSFQQSKPDAQYQTHNLA